MEGKRVNQCFVKRREQSFLIEFAIGIGIFAMEGFVDIAGHDVVVVSVCCVEGSKVCGGVTMRFKSAVA